ncbi:HNH endonuclease signature motif containing protein [Mycobacterium sp. URHB0021]
MFEGPTGAAAIDAMAAAYREESAATARRFAAIGQLDALRTRELAESIFWRTDPHDEVAAEVSAALKISRGRAAGQIHYARVLRDRLPEVAKVFAGGVIDFRMVLTIINRTENVEDDEVIARLDAALAAHASRWMRMSGPKLQDRVDLWVTKFDPAAVRVPSKIGDNRYVEVGETTMRMAGIWANIHAPDAAAFDKRLDALAASVCDNDPRTKEQRRADACGALGRLEERLACQCGAADCPAVAEHKAVADAVIHVLAEQATLDGTSDQPGYLPGFGILPAESVREVAKSAKLQQVVLPNGDAEPRYRPSAGLADFIRWRDLTCRWPGCDKPAERCDIDHTVPYPAGPTHASGLKLYCRTDHLIKTFFSGPGGWKDQQLPDGTVIFTSPSGHTYATEAHGGVLFPTLAQPTGQLPVPVTNDPSPYRAVMMPKRRRTREQDRRDRITEERRQRTELIAEEQRQRQAWLAATYEPPPF